jgi:serine/threonine protein kinase
MISCALLLTGLATTVSGETTTESAKGISSTAVSLISAFAVFGVMLVVISLILAFVFVRYCVQVRNRESTLVEHTLSKLEKKGDWDYVVNQTYSNIKGCDDNDGVSPKLREIINGFPQYKRVSIKYIRQIGQGNFGVVFYAKAEGVFEGEKETEVAVKTLKEEEHCSEALEDFVREAKLMFSFDHQNIVKILGVCTEEMPFYLIFEYMDKGDLAQFLRSSASSFQRHCMNPLDGRLRSRTESTLSDEPPSLNMDQLVDICRQIACGMKYLAENNHVHRDLACRNCLAKSCDWEQTDSGLIIKIGDFGMSQNLYSSDYYRVRGQAVLPVRWMSPEAVIYGKFSTDSDVWSFGVVMWEVFSFAMQPYYGTSNDEVTEAIRRHKILTRPNDCPNRIYELMKTCWTPEPKLRPGFDELYKILGSVRLSLSSSSDGSISQSFGSDLDSDAFEVNSIAENSMCEADAP